jgi:oligoribonuclease
VNLTLEGNPIGLPSMSQDLPHLIWVDCEMTGLDINNDALVEIAVLVTDAQLNVLGEGVDLVIKCEQAKLDSMVDVVKDIHTKSGLINEIPNGTTLAKADELIIAYLKRYAPNAGKSPLAGNSVYVDRAFIARDLPQLNAYLHYRTIDVSTIKELARRWYPKSYFSAPAKEGNHRALGDIRDSIAELDYYRSAIFIP